MIHEKFSTPELSNSLEDYIEAVRNIELEKGCATVGEIAEAQIGRASCRERV